MAMNRCIVEYLKTNRKENTVAGRNSPPAPAAFSIPLSSFRPTRPYDRPYFAYFFFFRPVSCSYFPLGFEKYNFLALVAYI
jgi:hypothetical protein